MAVTLLTNLPNPANASSFENDATNIWPQLNTSFSQFNNDITLLNFNSTTDTSSTSNSVATGAKTFTVSTGKSFVSGMYLNIVNTAAPTTNGMFCQVTSYSGSTLVVNVISTKGAGTFSAWTISISAFGGAGNGANSDITSLTGLTGSILVGGNGLVGYKAGAGGVVFQNTSKSTNVTLNKQSGVISVSNSNLNAGSSVSFTLANTFITESSLILLNRTTAFGSNAAYAFKAEPGSGGVLITIKNESASNLAEAFNLNFAVINISQT